VDQEAQGQLLALRQGEAIDAPVKALAAAREAAGIAPERFRVLHPGEVWNL